MLDPTVATAALPAGTISDQDFDRLLTGRRASEADFVARDRRTCDCELTYVHRKHHAALGTGVEIRLCCMAKFIEKSFGLEPGTFFFAMDFEPAWVWDCDAPQEIRRRDDDGAVVSEFRRLGPPPPWLLKRLRDKGVEVKNLPEGV
jgi:hypothetical protein